jgi:allantoate deiminase
MDAELLLAEQTARRLEELALVTDEPGVLTRTFLSPAMARANALVGGWFAEAGGKVEEDGWGNLIGHWPGATKDAATLLLGSHLDSVRNAGRFDGPMGVLVALAALQLLAQRGVKLPIAVDVLGFSDEEGTRFHSAYLGSKALAGVITEAELSLRDGEGISVAEAVAAYQGVKTVMPPAARYPGEGLLGYVEVHLEQGPVLEQKGLALGVVDHIAAQTRLIYEIGGKAGHAGTTPMNLRRDALAGAAELVLAIERLGLAEKGLVATVGQFQIGPGVSNVIPDKVKFSVDIRHPDVAVVEKTCAALKEQAVAVAQRRQLAEASHVVQSTAGVACSPDLTGRLATAVARRQPEVPHLVSGAGHDGIVLSRLTPMAMLFVRCRDGLSHHPDELVAVADIAASIAALADFLETFA